VCGGKTVTFLLTPGATVAEPGTLSLLALGLASVGLAMRRKVIAPTA
jgi:hypothetical protein